MHSPWFTVKDAARLAHVPIRSLYRAIEDGEILVDRKSARRSKVWYPDVLSWSKSRKVDN